jgi:hypothetical protein
VRRVAAMNHDTDVQDEPTSPRYRVQVWIRLSTPHHFESARVVSTPEHLTSLPRLETSRHTVSRSFTYPGTVEHWRTRCVVV